MTDKTKTPGSKRGFGGRIRDFFFINLDKSGDATSEQVMLERKLRRVAGVVGIVQWLLLALVVAVMAAYIVAR